MKTKSLPAVIMLVAGFIDCILAIIYHQSLWEFTRQLLLVLLIFYAIGCVVSIVININFKEPEEGEGAEGIPEADAAAGSAPGEEAEEKESFPEDLEDMEDISSEAE
jgi:phosphotransferase system  glucose/maltose/N-acetylglucosamine-specific IIC component